VVGKRVERVEHDLDGGALLAGHRVRCGPDRFVAGGLDAVVDERAADVLAAREILDPLARAGVEPQHDAVSAALPAAQRAREQLADAASAPDGTGLR
jgi:hypothetical protein